MLIAERLAEVAEYIRHFQPIASHDSPASGGCQVRRGRYDGKMQGLQRTGGGADRAGGDPQILCRGAQIAMAEQPRVIMRTFLCH